MAVCLFVQKVLPHFEHFTLCSNPFSSALTGASAFSLLGKLMALLWHRGSHAVQPLTHLCGFATIAFPSWKAKTSCGQNSTQRGFPIFYAAIAFFWENCWIPSTACLCHLLFAFEAFSAVEAVFCFKVCQKGFAASLALNFF